MIFFKRYQINRMTKQIKSLQYHRLHNQPSTLDLIKEKSLYYKLFDIFKKLQSHKKFPFANIMMWECMRSAALLDDHDAQYKLAEKLLEEAKFRDQLQKQGVFSSANNNLQIRQLYEESLAYLISAEKLGNIQAKRLHGLCYINRWGIEEDCDKGFALIVESINQENSWDRVPQIFATLGLNKSEFFAALTKYRDNK